MVQQSPRHIKERVQKWYSAALAALTVAGLAPVLLRAQGLSPATVQLSPSGYLVDSSGRSLYVYLPDAQSQSRCYDRCVENWPPLLTSGRPVAGPGVDARLLGTTARADGSTQVTYNGWPLYLYRRDDDPGETFGHGLGGSFYLLSAQGTPLPAPLPAAGGRTAGTAAEGQRQAPTNAAAPATDGVGVALDEAARSLMAEGERLFARNCAACHGAQGQGVVGPALAGNSSLRNTGQMIVTILFGRPEHGMPAWGDYMNDREVAAVATFIRNAWSNRFGPVTPQEVAQRR